ncbi:DNA primase, partial [Alphaproteobacteria bacterium]|nr:DNA primase [Alphaproteobacteria bacterium]
MSIPPKFLDEIRSRVTVSEIVGRTVKLIKAGREHKGCCPFHHEKTPSFTVSDDKQFYHCFGCGAHGDVINFLQQNNNLSFIEAVEMLATQAGLQVPKSTPQEVEKAKKAKDLYDLMDAATKFFQTQLHSPQNQDVLDYVVKRGLGTTEQQNFHIGYAPQDRQALRKHLITLGYSDKDMIEAGVTKPSSKGGDPYAFFNDRVMFPVTDRRGRVIAFGGRALPEHMRPPNQSSFTPPKYINSGDTALFDKGRSLYAIAQARQASGEGKPIIVTEGYMDVIACHSAGFTGAVAPMGTALTEEQVTLLWKIIVDHEKVPILCFDGDNAGRKAAARSVERIMPLLSAGHSVRFAFLPDGKDPDDLLKESGAKGFQKVLDSAISLLDFLWHLHTAGRNLTTPEA